MSITCFAPPPTAAFHPKPSIRGEPNPPALGLGSQAARNPSKPLCEGTSRTCGLMTLRPLTPRTHLGLAAHIRSPGNWLACSTQAAS
jgi:hypothetical protein